MTKLNSLKIKKQQICYTLTPFPTPEDSIYEVKFDPVADNSNFFDSDGEHATAEFNTNDLSIYPSGNSCHSYFQYPEENVPSPLLINSETFGYPYENIRVLTYTYELLAGTASDTLFGECSNQKYGNDEDLDSDDNVSNISYDDDIFDTTEFEYLGHSIIELGISPSSSLQEEDSTSNVETEVEHDNRDDQCSFSESLDILQLEKRSSTLPENQETKPKTHSKAYKPKRFLNKVCNIGEDVQNYDKLVELVNHSKDEKSSWFNGLFKRFSVKEVHESNFEKEISKLCKPLDPSDFEDELDYRQKLSKQNAFINCFL